MYSVINFQTNDEVMKREDRRSISDIKVKRYIYLFLVTFKRSQTFGSAIVQRKHMAKFTKSHFLVKIAQTNL